MLPKNFFIIGMSARNTRLVLGTTLACASVPTLASAQTPVNASELSELRAMVRQQAAALEEMRHRLDAMQGRQGRRETRSTYASPPQTRTARGTPTQVQPDPAVEGPSLAVGPEGKVPPPEQRNVAVTQQPGNLPGRSAVQPYTAANAASPGGVAPIPAAPVSAGGDRVRLSLSGQVNRMLLYGNDGQASAVRNVDNNNSSTRLRVVGEAQVNPTASGGINIETELRPNSSATTTLTQNLPQPASAASFTVRQAEAYFQDTRYGGVRLGFGSTASYLAVQNDLSGTAVASYVNVSDFDGGFAFRQRGSANVPAARGGLVFSPAGSYGPSVASVFNDIDGLGRDDRVRYDTPRYKGFQLATSVADGGAFDVALRYAGEYNGAQLVAAVAYADAVARTHLTLGTVAGLPGAGANLYGYAGVPTGANGTAVLGTATSPASGDVSANGSKQVDGSASLLLSNGLNFTVAAGYRDTTYRDPQDRHLTPTMLFGKVGYRVNLFPSLGITAMSVDYTRNDALQFSGDRAQSYSAALVQNIDGAATELYLSGRVQTLHRTYATYNDLIAIGFGARVRF